MPPPHHFVRNPNRDYVLLNQAEDAGADVEKRDAGPVSPTRLFALAREEAWTLVLASFFLLISSLAQVAFPKLSGQLIDVAIASQQQGGSRAEAQHAINVILGEVVAVVCVSGVAGGLRSWLFQSAAERVMFRLRSRLFAALLAQEVGFYDRVRTGELTNRLSEDTRQMRSAATTAIAEGLRAAAVTVLGLVMMAMTSWFLSLLTVLIIPPLFLLFLAYGRISRQLVRDQLAASARATTVAEECFSSLRTAAVLNGFIDATPSKCAVMPVPCLTVSDHIYGTLIRGTLNRGKLERGVQCVDLFEVRAFAKEHALQDKYEGAQGEARAYGLKSAALDGFFLSFNSSIATGAIMAVLWFGARMVLAGQLTAGALSAFVVYAVFVASNAGICMGVFSQVMQALGAGERVFQLLDRQPAMPASGDLRPVGAPEGGELQLQGVWFAYPSRPSAWVLKGFDLHVGPGKKVALVGTSGGGKSTVVALLERFYDPVRGSVTLDGVPLPLIDHAFLHQQVALVSQEPVLFAESIFSNIAFGCSEVPSMEQVEAAARVANAHDFISAFPQGYHTLVGERGVRLSGGQKQRVAIARAVIMNPRVLLLDEATSALDAESEHLVQEALERVASGRTVVVIAHRLSTVQTADEVAVVAGGLLVERGSHEALLAAGGAYAALVRRQLLGGPPEGGEGQEGLAGEQQGLGQPFESDGEVAAAVTAPQSA